MTRKWSFTAALIAACLTSAVCTTGLCQEMPSGVGGTMGGDNSVSVIDYSTGRSGGGDGRSISHSRSDVTDTTPYNALALVLETAEDGTMLLGGQPLGIAVEGEADTAYTASLGLFGENGYETVDSGANALWVSADAAQQWSFTGQTLKKLWDSGIDWLILVSGEQTAVIPTAEFLSGYKYQQWKASGIPSKDFLYSADLATQSLTVTVAGETVRVGEDPLLTFSGAVSFGGSELLNASAAQSTIGSEEP
ncbi:MAG: hypothetical protein PHI98_02590 [Eubacteriales bacterium]|nr:hypothetical protein [Eubacteriales bacterium]